MAWFWEGAARIAGFDSPGGPPGTGPSGGAGQASPSGGEEELAAGRFRGRMVRNEYAVAPRNVFVIVEPAAIDLVDDVAVVSPTSAWAGSRSEPVYQTNALSFWAPATRDCMSISAAIAPQ